MRPRYEAASYEQPRAATSSYEQLRAATSSYEQGCPIGAIAIEAPPEFPALRTATGEAFQAWSDRIADALVTHGVPHEVAKDLGNSAAAALEGAILVSKSAKNTEALTLTANLLAHAVA